MSHKENNRATKPAKGLEAAIKKIKREDITHRGFLKPIQIALKTKETEKNDQIKHTQTSPQKIKSGSLASGLKISYINEKGSREMTNVQSISDGETWETLKAENKNNLLSMMKQSNGIQLAICVCMYSEDKKMLKNTLAGISENIAKLVYQERLSPDKIGVFVMMDGIEKVDRSIIEYFEECQRSNGIHLGQNIEPSMTPHQINYRFSKLTPEQIEQEEYKNVSLILFDEKQLEEREKSRFEFVWSTYLETKKTIDEIKQLYKKKTLMFEDLPSKLQPYFIKEARQEWKKDYLESDEQVREHSDTQILEEYSKNINIARPIVQRSLRNAEKQCISYISERQDLAHLSFFRKKVTIYNSQVPLRATYIDDERQQLNQEKQQQNTTMNLFLCVKYKNNGKLSSHNWFFNGFCKQLKPKYSILLDVGLKPEEDALLKMYNYLKKNDRTVGGVCGYMSLKIEKLQQDDQVKDKEVDFLTSIILKFVDIQRTQQVQYHFAHLMDKPFESFFGFIHVLPGAFSGYNMKAIFDYENIQGDDQLLEAYFKSIDEKLKNRKVVESDIGVLNAILFVLFPSFINKYCLEIDPQSDEAMLYDENVYLAEDRILCMGIHKRGFSMAFLPDAYASVDPMKNIHGLLGQRKRWINGSYFAFQKVQKQMKQLEKQKGCQIGLTLQIWFLNLMSNLAYFSPSFFLFTVHIAMEAFRQGVLVPFFQGDGMADAKSSKIIRAFVYTMDFIYVLLLMTLVFYSLHFKNSSNDFKPYIYGISTLFGLFMVSIFGVLIVDIFNGFLYGDAFLVGNPENASLIDEIGGIRVVNAMRWMLVGSIAIYLLPISLYIIFFRRSNILMEIITGSLSFLFYSPTYLIILNVYSLCRIDDISWGTKGLDGSSSKNEKLKGSWQLVRLLHVSKFVIWNIILSVILLSLGANYKLRFYVTFAMVILIGLTMALKVVIGSVYLFGYKFGSCCSTPSQRNMNNKSSIDKMIDKFQKDIKREVRENLEPIFDEISELEKSGQPQSFIKVSRKPNHSKRAEDKMKQSQIQRTASRIQSKYSRGLAPIREEQSPQRMNKKKKGNLASIPEIKKEYSPEKIHSEQNSEEFLNKNSPEKYAEKVEIESKIQAETYHGKQVDRQFEEEGQEIMVVKKKEKKQKMTTNQLKKK